MSSTYLYLLKLSTYSQLYSSFNVDCNPNIDFENNKLQLGFLGGRGNMEAVILH
jgi:hypothetical protein